MFRKIYGICLGFNAIYLSGFNIKSTNRYVSNEITKALADGNDDRAYDLESFKWFDYREDLELSMLLSLLGPLYTYRILLAYIKRWSTGNSTHVEIIKNRHLSTTDSYKYMMRPLGDSSWIKFE